VSTGVTYSAVFHLFCCDMSTGMCGTDLAELPETDGAGEWPCVVCTDLDARACPRCGQEPGRG
jgi:hypothetical protein